VSARGHREREVRRGDRARRSRAAARARDGRCSSLLGDSVTSARTADGTRLTEQGSLHRHAPVISEGGRRSPRRTAHGRRRGTQALFSIWEHTRERVARSARRTPAERQLGAAASPNSRRGPRHREREFDGPLTVAGEDPMRSSLSGNTHGSVPFALRAGPPRNGASERRDRRIRARSVKRPCPRADTGSAR